MIPISIEFLAIKIFFNRALLIRWCKQAGLKCLHVRKKKFLNLAQVMRCRGPFESCLTVHCLI